MPISRIPSISFIVALFAVFLAGIIVGYLLSRKKKNPRFYPFFSKNTVIYEKLIGVIEMADKTINIAMYQLTDRRLVNKLKSRATDGVKIRILLHKNPKNEKKLKKYKRFLEKNAKGNIKVRLRGGKAEGGLFHHKFMIVDKKVVVLGSYNWSYRANKKNKEDLLIIFDDNLAGEYTRYFNKEWRGKK